MYKFNAMAFFLFSFLIPKFMWKGKGPRLPEKILKINNKVGDYNQDSVIKEKRNRVPSYKPTCIWTIDFSIDAKVIQWGKNGFSTSNDGTTLKTYEDKNDFKTYLTLYADINLRRIIDLNIKPNYRISKRKQDNIVTNLENENMS